MTEENKDNNASQESNNLDSKILELEEKLAKANDQILRGLAELENTRRRSREELEKANKYAISNFVSELVLPIENFFLVCDNAPQDKINESPEIKHFADAIDMTRKELMKLLEKSQVRRIFPLNEKFDHNFHEAIAQIESDKEEGVVTQVIQAGYAIGERLIRLGFCFEREKIISSANLGAKRRFLQNLYLCYGVAVNLLCKNF